MNRRDFFVNAGASVAAAGLSTGLPALAGAAPLPSVQQEAKLPAEDTFAAHAVGAGRRKQMWPIRSELKSKRIKFDAPIDPISWAYMKELRENNGTRTIYPANPYVEVYQFRDNLYGLFTHNLDGGGDVWMFLTVGPEKAMLVDVAYGLGDVKGLVDQLTGGKPLYVAVTHEHYDHAYGACRFEKVYCHECLAPYLNLQNAHQWDYLFDDYGDNIWVDFDRNDLPKFKKYEVAGVKDGFTFDLGGGHEIELLFQGGHSPGHAAYLDKRNRIVFTGDNIICDTSSCGSVNQPHSGPCGENTLLKVYRDNLRRLVNRKDEYDYVFPAHFMVDIEGIVLQNELDAIEAVLAKPEACSYKIEAWGKGATTQPTSVRYAKHIRDFSVILYTYKQS